MRDFAPHARNLAAHRRGFHRYGFRRHDRHLRHRIFFAIGFSIVIAVGIAGVIVHSASKYSPELVALRAFANDRLSAVWDDPQQRNDLVESIQRHFGVGVTLRAPDRGVLYQSAIKCERRAVALEVRRGNELLGYAEGCVPHRMWPSSVIWGLVFVVLVLWTLSGFIARSLVRPLDELVRVVRLIGDGHLDARMQLCRRHHRGEVGELGRAINQMAEKIERQIAGQRELLAAVSHEIRSPLARLRMLVELEREAGATENRLDAMDIELTEMDSLVGQLLAQSRLEFQNLERRTVAAVEIAQTALERAALSPDLLRDESCAAKVEVDVGLIGRALLNVVENAQRHGRGLTTLRVHLHADNVCFEVRDRGDGFEPAMLNRALLPFVGTPERGGLGLGLSLVQRIVAAHAGSVRLSNAEDTGAVVTLCLKRAAPP
ncbi:MAG TPA: HAMP domain-containing sensor histidine kinase [Polyangiaceae bacterium]|nr:HAMP domain-containing sensor histidine kinase [Polyangiaceae bacterium]